MRPVKMKHVKRLGIQSVEDLMDFLDLWDDTLIVSADYVQGLEPIGSYQATWEDGDSWYDCYVMLAGGRVRVRNVKNHSLKR